MGAALLTYASPGGTDGQIDPESKRGECKRRTGSCAKSHVRLLAALLQVGAKLSPAGVALSVPRKSLCLQALLHACCIHRGRNIYTLAFTALFLDGAIAVSYHPSLAIDRSLLGMTPSTEQLAMRIGQNTTQNGVCARRCVLLFPSQILGATGSMF